MVDTGFWVPPDKVARLIDPPVGARIRPDRDVTKPTTLFSGGGGLVSTAAGSTVASSMGRASFRPQQFAE